MTELNGHSAETLRYAYVETVLGAALVATSAIGVVAILIGDDPARLTRELGASLPGARLVHDEDGLTEISTRVAKLIAHPSDTVDIALDLRGSDLELAVWEALRCIPAGEISTYGAIAKALPIAATAQDVGAACAANRIAVAVPCHRVVKADGSISGYRWGVQRKRRLINMEAVA